MAARSPHVPALTDPLTANAAAPTGRPVIGGLLGISQLLALSLLLAVSCTPVAAGKDKPQQQRIVILHLPAPPHVEQIQGDARILHALNRLTFGPRPGDVEKVKAMGLDAWITQQLHPDSIDDSALQQKLQQFPSLLTPEWDLFRQFPPDSLIRQVQNGKMSMPLFNSTERAIYKNELAKYNARQAEQKAQAAGKTIPAPQNKPPELDTAALLSLPPGQRMAKLIALPPGQYKDFRQQLSPEQRTALADDMSPQQREVLIALDNPRQVVQSELLQSRVLHAVYSERQLQEVMTDFWLNHFNIFIGKAGEEVYDLVPYERDVIRPHALGHFEELLAATATSTAMMRYLDNATSIGPDSMSARGVRGGPFGDRFFLKPQKQGAPGLNENYGRELMELHTLGVNGGYTQRDVIEVAKVFTGWTILQPPQGGPRFVFDPTRHEPGPKRVLGVTIQDNGVYEGLQVLHMLATSPATAHFICRELAVRFVSDDPPQTLIDRMSAVFLASSGDIAQVMRFMLQAPEFWAVTAYRAKIKTPEDFVFSAARAGGADLKDADVLVRAMTTMGQPLYGMQTPNGYSMLSSAWINSGALLERMNFSLALAANRLGPGSSVDWDALLGKNIAGQSAEEKERNLETLLLHGQASDRTRAAIFAQLAATPEHRQPQPAALLAPPAAGQTQAAMPSGPVLRKPQPVDSQAALIAGLLFGSPDFQRR